MKYLKTILEFDSSFTRNEGTESGYIHPFVGRIQQVEVDDDLEKEDLIEINDKNREESE